MWSPTGPGRNEHGELHRGHKLNLTRPVAVAPPAPGLAALAFGHEHTVALTATHEVMTCGSWVAGKQADAEVTAHVTRLRKVRRNNLRAKYLVAPSHKSMPRFRQIFSSFQFSEFSSPNLLRA